MILTNDINNLYLYVFICGFIGDIIVNILSRNGIIGVSLRPYYNSLRTLFPNFSSSNISRNIKEIIYGGLFGGIACLIALFGADLIIHYDLFK